MNIHISLFNIDRKVKQIQVPLPPKKLENGFLNNGIFILSSNGCQ